MFFHYKNRISIYKNCNARTASIDVPAANMSIANLPATSILTAADGSFLYHILIYFLLSARKNRISNYKNCNIEIADVSILAASVSFLSHI